MDLKESGGVAEIEWESLWDGLANYAAALAAGAAALDRAIRPEDLVEETLLEFFRSPNKLGWDARRGTLLGFLKVRLRWRFIDFVRRSGEPTLPIDEEVLSVESGNDPNPFESAAFNLLCDRLMERIRGHPDEERLKEFILATSMTRSDGSKINQQMADLMLTNTREVVNLRKTLRRLAGDLHEEWKKGR